MSLEIKIGADIGDVDKALSKVGASLNGLKAPVLNAQNTLTSFSGVVRDLPFGFVAIQNNLPMVVDSFGQLSKQAGGAGPALKALAGSLMGPAGVSFAFGAVIAGVTALIQKYGSLGEAMTVIFSKNSEMAKAQQDYNKELAKSVGDTQTEISEINILTKTLANLNAPMKDRQAAYVELKKISPDIVAGIKDENNLTQAQIGIILSNAEARKKSLLLKAQESAISAVLNKNAEAMMKLDIERESLVSKLSKAEEDYAKKKKITFDATKTFGAGLDFELIRLDEAKKAYAENVNEYNKLIKVNDTYLSKLTPVISGIAEADLNTKKLNDTTKKQTFDQKAYNKSLEDQANLIREVRLRDAGFTKKGKSVPILIENPNKVAKGLSDSLAQVTASLQGTKSPLDYLIPKPEDFRKSLTDVQLALEETKKNIEDVFLNPLTDAFANFFETGKFAFKDFAKSILSAISQVVSKILATGIITMIANLLVPGSGGLTGGMGIGKFFGGIAKDVLGIGKVAAPSFAGVGGGSMGMTGSVNLTLRGSDLVGSINRTNSQINRVG